MAAAQLDAAMTAAAERAAALGKCQVFACNGTKENEILDVNPLSLRSSVTFETNRHKRGMVGTLGPKFNSSPQAALHTSIMSMSSPCPHVHVHVIDKQER